MKLLTIAITLSISATSLSSMASNVIFKPTNNTMETQVCYVAATEGLSAAKALLTKEGSSYRRFKAAVTCNGDSLKKFSQNFQPKAVSEVAVENTPSVTLVAKNTEAMVCLDALVMGEQLARKKHNTGENNIICNHKSIETFVRIYEKQNFVVRNAAQ
jgi:hypothetical protein